MATVSPGLRTSVVASRGVTASKLWPSRAKARVTLDGVAEPVTLGRTALEPLDSFTCPAVVVEISPLSGAAHVTPLSDPGYQDRLVAALAAAVEQWQRDWRQQP